MALGSRCLIIRGGQALILPASLATPAELAAGVENIEALCERVAGDYLRRCKASLNDDCHDELMGFLMLRAWSEAGRYAPRDGGSHLVGYLSQRLAWRCTDWYRSTFGETRRRSSRPRPVIISLDELREQAEPEPELDLDCA